MTFYLPATKWGNYREMIRPARAIPAPRALRAVLASLIAAGCGGRVSRPVAATTSYDDRLSCAHLHAEKEVNAERAADLAGEKRNDVANNIGFLVFSPLFLNLSDSEQVEIRAFAARDKVLDGLMAQRCGHEAALHQR